MTDQQLLVLDPPHELRFKGPFTESVSNSYLKITNPTEKRVSFKIKTTAPKRYCVRPNQGIVEPKETVTIAVMLQPFNYDPAEKNKHKFMVQNMFIPDGDVKLDQLWKDAKPDQLMVSNKLKCVFEMPNDNETAVNNVDTGANAGSAIIKDNKSSPKANTADSEIKKASDEVKRLREELSALRQENLQLKEEGLRLRRQATTAQPDLTYKQSPQASTTAPAPADPIMYWVIALVTFIIGITLGKFLL